MFTYFLRLGFLHLRRNPALTTLMVVTLAVGIAASISTLTVLRAMAGDPIPSKSERLFVPLIDLRPVSETDTEADPPTQLSYRDVVALHQAGRGLRQTALYRIALAIDSGQPTPPPFFGEGLAVHADMFPMFEVPFARGGPWTAEDDERGAQVVVIGESVAQRVFGEADPIGRTLRLDSRDHVVTGVVSNEWDPVPRFYRLIAGPGPFGGVDEVFIPFATAITAEVQQQGQTSCFGEFNPGDGGFEGLKARECVWIQLWVELASAADAPAYRDFLAAYVAEQRKLGRFPRPDNHRLHSVMDWLEVNEVVSQDTRLQTYLAFGFLLVCLVNTIVLLLAKFTVRSGEIGVRRALGAPRRAIFRQYLIEAGVVGLVGGVVGLGLTFAALRLLARQSSELEMLARMDWVMLGATFALAITASVLAGLLPTWRACQVQPATALKSQ